VTRNGEEGMKREMKKNECEDKMIEQSLKKRDKPDRPERRDRPTCLEPLRKARLEPWRRNRQNSLEIFENLYRIGREELIINQGQKYSLPQPIPQKCGMKGGE